jgi:glycosyltransferase involved in cell wall biosynthesis
MKFSALFINDHIFFKMEGAYYSQGGLPASVWERYLLHFDSLEIVARVLPKRDGEMVLSSRDRVSFSLSEHYTKPYDEITHKKEIDRQLIERVKKSDAVIVRLPSILGFRAISICKKIKKPYAIEVVGCPRDTYWNYGSIMGKIMSPIVFFRMKKAILNSKFTVYVTKSFLQQRYPSYGASTNISNVVIDDFPISVLIEHQAILKKQKSRLKLGMIGNIETRYKGYEVVFKALSKIKDQIPDFVLLLVGGGKSNWINNLAEKHGLLSNVEIIGVLSSGECIYSFLDTLDLYIHPSLTEGLPRAMIEAMSRGCPVLSSNAGGIPELIKTSYQHKAGDYDQLAIQLNKSLNDKEALVSMAQENFKKSKEYSQEVLQKKLYKFWSDFSNKIKTS